MININLYVEIQIVLLTLQCFLWTHMNFHVFEEYSDTGTINSIRNIALWPKIEKLRQQLYTNLLSEWKFIFRLIGPLYLRHNGCFTPLFCFYGCQNQKNIFSLKIFLYKANRWVVCWWKEGGARPFCRLIHCVFRISFIILTYDMDFVG